MNLGYAVLLLLPLFGETSSHAHDAAMSNQRRLRSSGRRDGGNNIQPSNANADTNHRHLTIADTVESIREEVRALIRNNSVLAPKFLRLAFHDCVGGCDGCVDMTNPDNAGLDIPMDALSGIVTTWKSNDISRADIWSLAAMVGSEMTQAQRDFR